LDVIRFLSYAEGADTSDSNLSFIVLCAALVIGVGFLAFFPIAFARSRQHRQADTIMAATLLWATIAVGMLIYVFLAQIHWSKEYLTRIQSGYGDPSDMTGAPRQPYHIWIALAAGYVTLVLWARHKKPNG
jgi:hypothetical protein